MSPKPDPWDDLASRWHDDPAPTPSTDLERLVRERSRRATLRLWLTIALELAVVIAVVLFTAATVAAGLTAFSAVHLLAVWVITVSALVFAVRNRKGIWEAGGDTTRDFLALAEQRARGKLRTARFALRLLAAQMAMVGLLWAWRIVERGSAQEALRQLLVIILVAAAYTGWSLWFRHRAMEELRWVSELRAAIENGSGEDAL